jgi:hypothetical protein
VTYSVQKKDGGAERAALVADSGESLLFFERFPIFREGLKIFSYTIYIYIYIVYIYIYTIYSLQHSASCSGTKEQGELLPTEVQENNGGTD